MPNTADQSLSAAVAGALTADPALSILIGRRIFDAPPPAATAPYLVVGRSETRPLGGVPPTGVGEAQDIVLTLSVLSQSQALTEARAVAAAARSVLHNAKLTLDGWRLILLRAAYVDVYHGADGRTALGIVRLRAVVEPL